MIICIKVGIPCHQVVKNLQHHDAIGGSWANVEVKVAAFDRILTALISSSLRLAARRPLCQKLNFLEPARRR